MMSTTITTKPIVSITPNNRTQWLRDAEHAAKKLKRSDIEIGTMHNLPNVSIRKEADVLDRSLESLAKAHFVWFPNVATVLKELTSDDNVSQFAHSLHYNTVVRLGNMFRKLHPELLDINDNEILLPDTYIASVTRNSELHIDTGHRKFLSLGYETPNENIENNGELTIWDIKGYQDAGNVIAPGKIFFHIAKEHEPHITQFTPEDQKADEYPFFAYLDRVVGHSASKISFHENKQPVRNVFIVRLHPYKPGDRPPFELPKDDLPLATKLRIKRGKFITEIQDT